MRKWLAIVILVALALSGLVGFLLADRQPARLVPRRPFTLPKWIQVGFPGVAGIVVVSMFCRWVVVNLYQAWRTWRQDLITLTAMQIEATARARREQVVRLTPDAHGFGGVVHDQGSGVWRDLDTGEVWTPEGEVVRPDPERLTGNVKQRWLAALSGLTVRNRVVQQIVGDDEKPQIQVSDEGWLQLESGELGGEIEM